MQLSSHDEFVYGQRDTYRIKVALNDVIIAIFRTLSLEWPILTYKQRYFFQIFQPKRKHVHVDLEMHTSSENIVYVKGWWNGDGGLSFVTLFFQRLHTTRRTCGHWDRAHRLCPPPVYWCPHLVLKATGAPDYQCNAMSPPIFSTFRRPYYS